ncbi:GGDEF domain-containing protein [Pararhizobium sp. BT-229]|uniref:GGDEF domain-containing protein n=1 Tax=Pararhizobium sp. BT-229 TaxID=2986923 RepID=UPI0021F7797A|nr:GGDEF domain-containing protein [Pararhizobium sp. BT-229]MCV9960986.1 GGDEF domain-containing protein [Pararhizobium sp. BT-229]
MSFLSAIAVISLVVTFPVLLSLRKTGVPGISNFCTACGLSALSAGTCLTSAIAPMWLPAVVGSTLMIAAGLKTLDGFREFLGQKPLGLGSLVTTLAGAVLVLAIFSFGIDSPAARASFSAALGGLIYSLTGVTIMRHWSKERAIVPYMIFCCVAAFAVTALHIMRVIADTADFAEPHLWMTALMAARLLIVPLFFLGVILMLHGWMIASLRHMIAHDDLTGALSRRAFMTKFERMFATAARSNRQTAFMLLDLDRFKQINDLHGHAGGDAALAHFTGIVRETLGGHGIFGRLGGEEFGIGLAGIGRLEAAAIAEAICAAVRTTPARTVKETNIALTVSIGIAMADPGNTLAEVMVQADMALYEAKAMGRDRLSIASSLQAPPAASARALAGAAAQMRAAATIANAPTQPLANTG